MMDQFGEELKKVVQAGFGAVAAGVEKAQEAVETLSKKGEPIYQQAKSAVTDAAGKLKQAFENSGIADALCGKPQVAEIIDTLRGMSKEDWALVREALDVFEAQTAEAEKEAAEAPRDDEPAPPADGDTQA